LEATATSGGDNGPVAEGELGQALGRAPGAYTVDSLHVPVAGASAGVWRATGDGWSVVLKLVRHGAGGHENWQSGENEDHWYYWRREALAYESGLLASLAGQARAARCLHVGERGDGSVALWLEDVGGEPGQTWSLRHYRRAARHLGQAQGEFAAGRPLPPYRWLSRDWLRAYLRQRDGDRALVDDPDVWELPRVRPWLPSSLAGPLREMRAGQPRFLAALDGLPRTLCHLDLHPANLFAVGGETVVIDWSFVGAGAVGEDAGNLVADAVLDFHVGPEHLDALFDAVLTGYVEGLADAGFRASPDVVRLGMTATLAAKYAWIGPAVLRAAVDEKEMLNRRPFDDTLQWWAPTVEFLLRQTSRARDLLRRANG